MKTFIVLTVLNVALLLVLVKAILTSHQAQEVKAQPVESKLVIIRTPKPKPKIVEAVVKPPVVFESVEQGEAVNPAEIWIAPQAKKPLPVVKVEEEPERKSSGIIFLNGKKTIR